MYEHDGLTLKKFIEQGRARNRTFPNFRAHLREKGWNTLYVRYGRRVINGWTYDPMLDIATIEVEEELRGMGKFTRLLERLRREYPWLSLYVENAMAHRLQAFLLRFGFMRHPFTLDCFYLPATAKLPEKPKEEPSC